VANVSVSAVVDLLQEHGFRPQPIPVTIGPIDHDFPAVLLGSERSPDLVVVVDTVTEPDEKRIHHRVRGLAHALDVVRSRRSLSVVITGPRLSAHASTAVGRVARVLNVGIASGPASAEHLHEALAVLLPLELPVATSGPADALGALRKSMGEQKETPFLRALVSAASKGSEAVSSVLRSEVDRALASAVEVHE